LLPAQEGKEDGGAGEMHDEDSNSCDDVAADKESNMSRTVRQSGVRIKKGMWLQLRVRQSRTSTWAGSLSGLPSIRLTRHHITLWYYGDKFLQLYMPLHNEDNTKAHLHVPP